MRKLLLVIMLMVGSFAYAKDWVWVCDSKIGTFFVDKDYTNSEASRKEGLIIKVRIEQNTHSETTVTIAYFEYSSSLTFVRILKREVTDISRNIFIEYEEPGKWVKFKNDEAAKGVLSTYLRLTKNRR